MRAPHIPRLTHLSEDVMNSILYRIRQCNYMPPTVQKSLIEFVVEDRIIGKVRGISR